LPSARTTRNGCSPLRDHFEARRLYEEQQFAAFDRQKLIRLRNDLAQFCGDENEAVYQQWKRTGSLPRPADIQPHAEARGTFSTYRLEHRYEFLGALGSIDEYLKAV